MPGSASSSQGPSPRTSFSGLNGLYTQPATAVDVANFRPMDPDRFPGDKESKWTLKADQDTFRFMHNAIRAEVTKFEALLFRLGDRPLKKWEKDAIKEWWIGHHEHVAHHHRTEDEMLHPMVRTRVAVMAEFETSHDELNALLTTVDKAIRNRNFQTAAELAPVWHGYRTALYPHLVEEENIMIPLMRAYFTPAEMQVKSTEILKTMPKLALGSLLHHIAGGKEGVMTFMARLGYNWHQWYTEVHAIRTAYREQMESKLESLLQGEPMVCKHKAEFTETHNLRPLRLNERLVRQPSNARDLASRITAELSTGRLSVQDALAEVGDLKLNEPNASKPQYMQPTSIAV